jgi:F0F1-type ATP synthase membrane subunit b/b'
LAIAGAEKILERSISEEDNRDIVDGLAAQL